MASVSEVCNIVGAMVRAGARAAVLLDALTVTGLKPLPGKAAPSRPTLGDLPSATATEVLAVYHALGGTEREPILRAGGWDLPFVGPLLVELDEELHFNRYRAATLAASWEREAPWTEDYRRHCVEREAECLSAGAWGKRWTNDSSARMFKGEPPGSLNGDGAPRWKQRALYDSLKDTLPVLPGGARLARIATHDTVSGISLGAMLDGMAPVDPDAIRSLVDARTT